MQRAIGQRIVKSLTLASDTPVVKDCIINSDDKVWPMVAPGEAISSAFTGDDLKKKQEE